MSGYFEPNNTIDDQMYGAEDMEDDEEGEDDISESDEEVAPKLVPVKDQKKVAVAPTTQKKPEPVKAETKPSKDVQGFQKGGDLEKSLKIANKNTLKNSVPQDSESDEDEMDEEEEDDFGDFDMEAEEGEDEDIDSDLEDDSEDEKLMKKLQEMKNKKAPEPVKQAQKPQQAVKPQQAAKPVAKKQESSDEDSDAEVSDVDDSDDSENDL